MVPGAWCLVLCWVRGCLVPSAVRGATGRGREPSNPHPVIQPIRAIRVS
jgi:hypothetical protein